MTRFGPGLDHSPAGPGPIIQVQVHPYLDLDPDIWGLVWSGPGSARSRTGLWTVYIEQVQCSSTTKPLLYRLLTIQIICVLQKESELHELVITGFLIVLTSNLAAFSVSEC